MIPCFTIDNNSRYLIDVTNSLQTTEICFNSTSNSNTCRLSISRSTSTKLARWKQPCTSNNSSRSGSRLQTICKITVFHIGLVFQAAHKQRQHIISTNLQTKMTKKPEMSLMSATPKSLSNISPRDSSSSHLIKENSKLVSQWTNSTTRILLRGHTQLKISMVHLIRIFRLNHSIWIIRKQSELTQVDLLLELIHWVRALMQWQDYSHQVARLVHTRTRLFLAQTWLDLELTVELLDCPIKISRIYYLW